MLLRRISSEVVPRPQRDFKAGFLAMLPKHALRLRSAKQPSQLSSQVQMSSCRQVCAANLSVMPRSPKSGPAQSPRLSPKPSPKLSPKRSPIAANRSTGRVGAKEADVTLAVCRSSWQLTRKPDCWGQAKEKLAHGPCIPMHLASCITEAGW